MFKRILHYILWRRPIIGTPTTEQVIDDATYPLVSFPFRGLWMFFRVRKLTAAQVYYVDPSLSLIATEFDKHVMKMTPTFSEMAAYVERQHKLLKLSLVSPSYQEILDICGARLDMKEVEAQMKELNTLFDQAKPGKKKEELRAEYNLLEFQYKFLLPTDFISAVLNYALEIAETDIKLVTDEMLYNAAIMAIKGHDSPEKHCPGIFNDFNREDINRRAWILYQEKHPA